MRQMYQDHTKKCKENKKDMDTILVVDDSEILCAIIKDILKDLSLHVEIVHSGEEGIEMAKKIKPTLILLDIIMKGMDGYQTCNMLKSLPETKDIPIIFITGNDDSGSILRGFEIGAADYVSKPFIPEELKARVKVHLQTIKVQRELQSLTEEFRILATTDYLTKLYNRRFFMEQLYYHVYQSTLPLSLVLFDVDDFKKINDTYGHNTGDTVLVSISKILTMLLDEEHIICRWGGEEIMICLHGVPIEVAIVTANKLRTAIADHTFYHNDYRIHCTVTGGVLPYNRDLSLENNISFLDQALYKGKTSGKNCCVVSCPSED